MREEIPNIENDEQIADMLSGLSRVQAPENFEFSVKARIAKGEQKGLTSPFAFLKIAIPAVALASLAMFLYVSGFMSGDLPTVHVAEQQTKPEAVVVSPSEQTRGVVSREQASNDREVATARTNVVNNRTRNGSTQRIRSSNGGGSYDATSDPDPPILPEGRAKRADEVLTMVGIDAGLRNDRFVANSIAEGSPAERIGVRSGDLILALNDIPILRSTTIKGELELKSIRVDRAGRNIKLKF